LHTTGERFGNPLIGPTRTVNISLEQHVGTANFLARPLELLDDLLKLDPFFIRKSNDILLLHGKSPCAMQYLDIRKTANPKL
jgi:hypothetical protein